MGLPHHAPRHPNLRDAKISGKFRVSQPHQKYALRYSRMSQTYLDACHSVFAVQRPRTAKSHIYTRTAVGTHHRWVTQTLAPPSAQVKSFRARETRRSSRLQPLKDRQRNLTVRLSRWRAFSSLHVLCWVSEGAGDGGSSEKSASRPLFRSPQLLRDGFDAGSS